MSPTLLRVSVSRTRRLVILTVAVLLLVAAFAPAAYAAYLATESGSVNCGGYPMEVYTRVHADGGHKHTIVHSTTTYGDAGYVRNTYKYSDYPSASWATSGGHVPPGYYDYSGSGGWCRYDP